MAGGKRTGNEKFTLLTGRRSAFESVVAAFADERDHLTVRRGTAVDGLVTGTMVHKGVPHVTGVRTESGEIIESDLVVDATGRRSPLPRWLTDIGARGRHTRRSRTAASPTTDVTSGHQTDRPLR